MKIVFFALLFTLPFLGFPHGDNPHKAKKKQDTVKDKTIQKVDTSARVKPDDKHSEKSFFGFDEFPSLHPLIVHFPIVLILLAVAFQAALVWKDMNQLRWVTLVIMAGGFITSWAASNTFHAMISDDAPQGAMDMFAQHEKYAQYTLWMSGFTLVLKSIGDFYKMRRRSYESIVLVAAVVTAIFLSITGHHGARLTHVAGVGPMGRYLDQSHGVGGAKHKGNTEMGSHNSDKDTSDGMTDMDMTGKRKPNEMQDLNGEENMHGMDMKTKKDKNNRSTKETPGVHHNKGMEEMDMSEIDNKKGMKGMKMSKIGKHNPEMDMEGMGEKDGRKRMNMPAMKKEDKMDGMDMSGMDNEDMHGMKMKGTKLKGGKDMGKMEMSGKEMDKKDASDMKGMDMEGMEMSPMDTFKFEDNNPSRKKNNKR